MMRNFRQMIGLVGLATMAWCGVGAFQAHAEPPEVANRRAEQRQGFSDAEIRNGFFKIALDAELALDAPVHRIRKFDEPVRIFIDAKGSPQHAATLAAIAADIRRRVDHLDLALTEDRDAANFIVTLVASRDLVPVIRSRFGREKANKIEHSLNPQCLSGIAKDDAYRIRRAEVILPTDAGEFTFYDCAYEELLQGLGAINDDATVPWTMFNDTVQMGFFDLYDQYLLNILYDPRIRPGMTRAEVEHILPAVLGTVRDQVSRNNQGEDTDAAHRPHPN